jgi:hypothetical protein
MAAISDHLFLFVFLSTIFFIYELSDFFDSMLVFLFDLFASPTRWHNGGNDYLMG